MLQFTDEHKNFRDLINTFLTLFAEFFAQLENNYSGPFPEKRNVSIH